MAKLGENVARLETLVGRIRERAAEVVEQAGKMGSESVGLKALRLSNIAKLHEDLARQRKEAFDVLGEIIRGGDK